MSAPSLAGSHVAQRVARVPPRVQMPIPAARPASPRLAISKPADAAERDAGQIARRALMLPAQAIASPAAARFDGLVPARGSGEPLPMRVRQFMEPRLRADFSGVRVHTGAAAAQSSRQFGAAAFTVGQHIFFGAGRFQPDSAEGRELMAHELVHTMQQGPGVQRLGIADARAWFAEHAAQIPGYRLLALALGRDPISQAPVPRTAAIVLRTVLESVPLGAALAQALDRYGLVDRAALWAAAQLDSTVAGTVGIARQLRDGIGEFLSSLAIDDIFDPAGVWVRARRLVAEPAGRVLGFARTLQAGAVELARDAALAVVAPALQNTAAYPLLCAVLGADPVTGTPSPRTPGSVIGGFMALIGQGEIWVHLQGAQAVDRGWAWFTSALAGVMGFARELPARFVALWRSLTLADLWSPMALAQRAAGVFVDVARRFAAWAGEAAWGLLEIVFSTLAPNALPLLRRIGPGLRNVLRDPAGFGRNLTGTIVGGLRRFGASVSEHLRSRFVQWLTSLLSGTGVEPPRSLSPADLLRFANSAFGAGWTGLRRVLAAGPVALWTLLRGGLAGLHEMVVAPVIVWVHSNVAVAGINRLMASLHPAGTFIAAIVAIERSAGFITRQLAPVPGLVLTIFDSLPALVGAAVTTVASRVESALSRSLANTIDLLARLLGLGGIGARVLNIVRRVQAMVDRAIDALLQTLAQAGRGSAAGGPAGVASLAGRMRRIAGVNLFRSRAGRWEVLPADVSPEDAMRLEAEGEAAQRRIEAAAPRPVAALRPAPVAKPALRIPRRAPRFGARGARAAGAGARSAGAAAALAGAVGNRPVAFFLATRGVAALSRGVARLHTLKRHEQTHDSAAQKTQQAEQAVLIPRSDEQSKGNAAQVLGVQAVQRPDAPMPDPAKARTQLGESLRRNVPRTLEGVDNFKREKRAQRMTGDVAPVVHGEKDAVISNFGEMRHTPEAVPSGHTPRELPAPEAAPVTAGLQLGAGLLAPLQKEHLDASAYPRDAERKLAEEGVTQEQLDMVDSGDLAQARRDKAGLEQAARTEPVAAQKFAQNQALTLDTSLRAEEMQQRRAMHAQRGAALGQSAKRQRDTRSALEKKREAVAAEINGRYEATQKSVKKKLDELERESMRRFDAGNVAAAQAFEDQVKTELDAYKADRYAGFFGRLRKARDWFWGIDDLPGVKAIFERNRAIFVAAVQALVDQIAADNRRVVQGCKDEIAATDTSIKVFVVGLEPGLRGIGNEAAREIGDKLRALDQTVARKETELRQQLQDKQQAAIKAIDEKIEKMKEAMAGALAKLGKLLLWAAKKFFTWALGQFGYSLSDIQSIIDKGVAVLKAIFTGPIRFVKNLIKAAKDGFAGFRERFPTHLKDALFEWLTGSLTGVRLPEVWNTRGVLSLALQVLRISGDAVRRKLLLKLGGDQRLLAQIERATPLVQRVLTEGPAAAWDEIKSEAAELEREVIEKLRNYVIVEIVKRAVTTVLQMFVPGAGIVRAIIGIYDTVVFFIQKARDIARMVGSFLGSIGEVAAGNTAGAAAALEQGLARALKLVIEFLARFLRLSGIPAMLRSKIEAVAGRAEAMVDRVVDWVIKLAKRVGLGVAKGARAVARRIAGWWAARKTFKTEDGQSHTLYFSGEEHAAVLMLRSDPTLFSDFVKRAQTKGDTKRENAKKQALRIAALLDAERAKSATGADEAARERSRAQQATRVNELLDELAPHTSRLFKDDLPDSFRGVVNLKPNAAQFGLGMTVKPLTKIKRPAGSPPTSTSNVEYERLNARRESAGGASFYVKGHLLNQGLGGPGDWENLVPLSRQGNARHETQAEAVVKRTVDLAAIVEYEVKPSYATRSGQKALLDRVEGSRDPQPAKREKRAIIEAERWVPLSLTVKAYILDAGSKRQGTLLSKEVDNPVPRVYEAYFLATTPRPEPVNLSTAKAALLETVPGIGPAIAKRIVEMRKLPEVGGQWSSYKQLARLVGGISEATLQAMQDADHIRLFSRGSDDGP